MTYLDYPENKPTESAYYITHYHNPELNDMFYKAIWYNADTDQWVAWRRGVEGLVVHRYVPESANQYYVPCMMWREEQITC